MGLVAVCEILMMICEIANINGCETTMLLQSHPMIAISPIGFRHYNTNIYRAVPFFTLWLPSRHSPFRVLPFWSFWSSPFLLVRVAVLDVDVRIMTSSIIAQ